MTFDLIVDTTSGRHPFGAHSVTTVLDRSYPDHGIGTVLDPHLGWQGVAAAMAASSRFAALRDVVERSDRHAVLAHCAGRTEVLHVEELFADSSTISTTPDIVDSTQLTVIGHQGRLRVSGTVYDVADCWLDDGQWQLATIGESTLWTQWCDNAARLFAAVAVSGDRWRVLIEATRRRRRPYQKST